MTCLFLSSLISQRFILFRVFARGILDVCLRWYSNLLVARLLIHPVTLGRWQIWLLAKNASKPIAVQTECRPDKKSMSFHPTKGPTHKIENKTHCDCIINCKHRSKIRIIRTKNSVCVCSNWVNWFSKGKYIYRHNGRMMCQPHPHTHRASWL